MPEPVRSVDLGDYSAIARLVDVGGEGRAEQLGGEWWLRGSFALQLLGKTSAGSDFPPNLRQARLEKTGHGWTLAEITNRSFDFANLVKLPDREDGPWLLFDRATLRSVRGSTSAFFLALANPRVDFVGGADAPPPETLRYPKALGGVALAGLRADSVPGEPLPRDFYVMPFVTGFTAYLGQLGPGAEDPIGAAKLNHVAGMVLHLPYGSSVEFRVWESPRGDPLETSLPFVFNAGGIAPPVKAVFADSTQLSVFDEHGEERQLNLDEIRGGLGWLTARKFRNELASLRRRDGAFSDLFRLHVTPEMLRFHVPLRSPAEASPDEELAQIVYRDGTVDGAPPGSLADRRRHLYIGLQVRGLVHHRAASNQSATRLDASWLRVCLTAGRSQTFEVKAGQERFALPPTEFERAGSASPKKISRLVPKIDDDKDGNKRRTLKVPCAGSLIELDTEGDDPPSVISIDSQSLQVAFHGPQIEVLPVGSAATATTSDYKLLLGAATSYRRMTFRPPAGDLDTFFNLDRSGLTPVRGAGWLSQFKCLAARFDLKDHPGASFVSLGLSGSDVRTRSRAAASSTVVTTRGPDGKEILAYSLASFGLTYKLVPGVSEWLNKLRDDLITVEIGNLNPPPPWAVDTATDDLLVLLQAEAGPNNSVMQFRSFIDRNMANNVKPEENPKEKFDEYVWPLAAGLSIVLWRNKQPIPAGGEIDDAYVDQIAELRRTSTGDVPRVRLAIDMSSKKAARPDQLGWGVANWQNLKRSVADVAPTLWPRLSDVPGSRLDPSDPLWRGFFFRQLPLTLAISKRPDPRSPIGAFFQAINQNLLLDYGWKDETGTSFSAAFVPGNPIDLLPSAWADYVRVTLDSFECTGASNTPASASVAISIIFNAVQVDAGEGRTAPLTLDGRFMIDLTKNLEFSYIDLVVRSGVLATKSFPGFDQISIVRARSDLRRVAVDLELTPDPALTSIFPGLAAGDGRVRASLSLDLEGKEGFDVALVLPTGRPTPLFGIWPAEVTGMRMRFVPPPHSDGPVYYLTFRCSLSLGVRGLEAIGADVILERRGGGGWSLTVQPVSISAQLSLPSFSLGASLNWEDEDNGASGPIPNDPRLPEVARNRAFWGFATLKSEFLHVDGLQLSARISGQGRVPSWVVAIKSRDDVNIGIAKLKDPIIVLASHADLNGRLTKTLQNVETPLVRDLLPPYADPDPGPLRAWLRSWQPSDAVGLMITASCALHVDDIVASAPSEKEKRTTIVVTDSGLVRIDAYLKLFGLYDQPIGIVVDFVNKYLAAAFQGPSFTYPPGTNEYHISAGEVAVRIGFGGRKVLRLSLGWPIAGDDFAHEDWSKAIEVKWDAAFPLNTFSGGVLVGYDGDLLELGIALRAGWTKEYSQEIISSKLAKVSASLSVFVGGIVYFSFRTNASQHFELLTVRSDRLFEDARRAVVEHMRFASTTLSLGDGERSRDFARLYQAIADDFDAMASSELGVHAVLFAEVDGSASAELLGVTIASITVRARAAFDACGDTHRGVVRVHAEVGFSVSVTIACVTVNGSATIPLDLVNRDACSRINGRALPLLSVSGGR
ncbi:hypothetical protein [Bradyrhizobium sp. SZCCHNS3004]|uniref:hypothetical protein n=1 Tax=Bradyrhizobium sp. SZCCHNS3004 TaxID=3057312 RepID=UPI0029170E3A|nr:hypothetical protein [Bradyrhizobium sp. SZCCHNS3004]